jgi:hypothetical protein
VRDEKTLEKLATHEVKDVSELFSLADKCARATKGRAWHSQPFPEARKASKLEANVVAQSNSKSKNRKKKSNNNKLLAGTPTIVAVARPPTMMRVCHGARCTTLGTTASRSAGRSRSSWNSSVSSRSSSHATMARLSASGKGTSNLLMRTAMRRWSSRMPRG